MDERVEQVTQTTGQPGVNQTEVTSTAVKRESLHGGSLAARIIGFITTIIIVLLAVRFVLLLLGANTSTGFGDFITSITGWMVVPFNGLFSNPVESVRFEPQTLTAMIVYGLVGAALGFIATIRQPK